MYDLHPSGLIQIFCGHTEVVRYARAEVIDTAIRRRRTYQGWYSVDDQAKLAFALARCFFLLFSFFYVPSDAVPANHLPLFIPESSRTGMEPVINAVGPKYSQLMFDCVAAA